jgi:glycosyltransferase involved in cell wall biosynthesis
MFSPTSPAPRRVVLVTNGLTRAGAETQLVRLASALRHRGDEVGLLSIMATEAFAEEVAALDIPVAHLRVRAPLRGPSAIQAGARVLRAWQPDALISFVYQANVLGRLAGRLAGVPVVISSVRNEHFGGRARELVMRATDRLSTITTTNSQLAAAGLVKRGVVPGHRLVVIPNGIDLAPFQQAEAERSVIRSELGIPDGQFVWLAVGRLEPQKDYPTLFAALARCPTSAPEHCLLIAGQGRLRSELERTAAELGLSHRIRFLGLREDVPQLVAAADGVVLSSRFEGMPNIVMEAMAGARPVVATRVGGTPELVEHGGTGLLVDPGDPGALSSAMREVMAAPESTRRAMGSAGRSAIAERYSLAALADQWLRLLDRCLADTGAGRSRTRPPLSAAVPGALTPATGTSAD